MKNVDLPKTFGNAKVVQLYLNNQPWLVGRADTAGNPVYHPLILEEFLIEHDIQFQRNKQFLPVLEGRQYRVAGMGVCSISKGTYYFGGFSESYSELEKLFGIDKKHLEDFKKVNPGFRYRVRRDTHQ